MEGDMLCPPVIRPGRNVHASQPPRRQPEKVDANRSLGHVTSVEEIGRARLEDDNGTIGADGRVSAGAVGRLTILIQRQHARRSCSRSRRNT